MSAVIVWKRGIWAPGIWYDNTRPYQNTGSNEKAPICFEDGVQAQESYGVLIYQYDGACLNCQAPISITLDFNPLDGGHYYARCPLCNTVWRHLNPDGSLSDFKVVVVGNKPKLERELSDGFEDNWGETNSQEWY